MTMKSSFIHFTAIALTTVAAVAAGFVTACATPRTAAAEPTEITFRAGRMIEVAFFKIKPGKEAALRDRYFAKVMPIAAEYGLRPIGTFAVTKTDHGAANQFAAYGFFEWPSVDAKRRFEADPRFAPLRALRDSMLATLPAQVYLRVKETVTVPLRNGRVYEAAVAWANPERQARLKAYFDAAGPFIAERRVAFHGQFEVIGQPDDPRYTFDAPPNTFLFIEWPNDRVKAQWFSSPAFSKVGHHRAMALDRLLVLESKRTSG